MSILSSIGCTLKICVERPKDIDTQYPEDPESKVVKQRNRLNMKLH